MLTIAKCFWEIAKSLFYNHSNFENILVTTDIIRLLPNGIYIYKYN